MITIDAKTIGFDPVTKKLRAYPKSVNVALKHWMYSTRKMFVGKQKKGARAGVMQRTFSKLKRSRRPGKWSKSASAAFVGRYKHSSSKKNTTHTMTMGLMSKRGSKFVAGLRMMDKSYAGSRNIRTSKYMTIPILKNIKRVFRKSGTSSKKKFDAMSKMGLLTPVKIGTNIYWFFKFGTTKRGGFKKNALLFVGRKNVRLRAKYSIRAEWTASRTRVIKRGRRLVAEKIRSINRGYANV